jgi:thioredoxin reductase
MADMGVDKTPFRELPRAIRAATPRKVAIFTVCKYRDLEEAERLLAAGDADMVGMARAHIADPAIVNKTREGRTDEIRRCIGCNQGCAYNLEKNLALTCFVNPRAGREGSWPEGERAKTAKEVLVIGGGPAGMEAAAIAASRGHRVRLWESSDRLGGRLQLAAGLRLREDFGLWLDHARKRLARLNVRIELGRTGTAQDAAKEKIEAVILATGAEPVRHLLADGTATLTLDEAAQADLRGKRVAVYDETGDWGAYGLVEHLAEQGAKVTVITPAAGVMWRTTIYSTLTGFARWREKRIRIMTLRRPQQLQGTRLTLEDTSCGETSEIDVDTLVGCVPSRAQHALEAPLAEAGIAAVLVGDCLAPRNALEAIFEGHRAARAL